ncbi:MAG TPA: hypothetical protein VHT21_18755, partial [Stellaceae bacterium]|nr:hypothetical protein [Stellaceae bacterium]
SGSIGANHGIYPRSRKRRPEFGFNPTLAELLLEFGQGEARKPVVRHLPNGTFSPPRPKTNLLAVISATCETVVVAIARRRFGSTRSAWASGQSEAPM